MEFPSSIHGIILPSSQSCCCHEAGEGAEVAEVEKAVVGEETEKGELILVGNLDSRNEAQRDP